MDAKTEAALRDAAAVLARATWVGALGHVYPDGDALGSALALAWAARDAGLDSAAAFGDPFEVPDNYGFLPMEPIVAPGDLPERPEVIVAFDTASFDRLGNAAAAARRAGTLIVVDHHASNEGFGDISVVAPDVASSAELAYRLIREIGWPVGPEAATCLYTGIVTDTGRFQYSSTSPGTLRIAAELLEAGVRPEQVGQNLFEKVPFGYLALSSRVLGRAVLDQELSLVWSVMTRDDLAACRIEYADSDPLIDDLRIAREAGVALLLKEVGDGFKVSLRSRGEADVGRIAVALGGGGHHNASGFTHPGPSEEIVTRVSALLRDA